MVSFEEDKSSVHRLNRHSKKRSRPESPQTNWDSFGSFERMRRNFFDSNNDSDFFGMEAGPTMFDMFRPRLFPSLFDDIRPATRNVFQKSSGEERIIPIKVEHVQSHPRKSLSNPRTQSQIFVDDKEGKENTLDLTTTPKAESRFRDIPSSTLTSHASLRPSPSKTSTQTGWTEIPIKIEHENKNIDPRRDLSERSNVSPNRNKSNLNVIEKSSSFHPNRSKHEPLKASGALNSFSVDSEICDTHTPSIDVEVIGSKDEVNEIEPLVKKSSSPLLSLTYSGENENVVNLDSDTEPGERKINTPPSYPVYDELKKKLCSEDRQIDYIRGDGNCFFRALSKLLYGSERYHKAVRNLVVDIIATNKVKFTQFVDKEDVQTHVEKMSEENTWATTCEIYAAATLLQRDLYMLTPNFSNTNYSWLLFKPVFVMKPQAPVKGRKKDVEEVGQDVSSTPFSGQLCKCYLTMCNTNGNHYDRIVSEHGGCNCFLPVPKLDGISVSVDLTS